MKQVKTLITYTVITALIMIGSRVEVWDFFRYKYDAYILDHSSYIEGTRIQSNELWVHENVTKNNIQSILVRRSGRFLGKGVVGITSSENLLLDNLVINSSFTIHGSDYEVLENQYHHPEGNSVRFIIVLEEYGLMIFTDDINTLRAFIEDSTFELDA